MGKEGISVLQTARPAMPLLQEEQDTLLFHDNVVVKDGFFVSYPTIAS